MSNVAYLPTRKQLDVTDAMLEQIQFVADTDVKADDIVVFEATVLSTLPLTKPGSLFDGGRHTNSTLLEMAEAVNTKGQSVPLHTMHNQSFELPVGRVFHANVEDRPDGQSELRARFFLAKSESRMIEKINLGILDETSVGVTHKALLCSKCGFDYRGEEATFDNLWDRTCNNGHTLGEDGTHLVLQGMDRWMELSLVSRGAAEKAKIHGRARSLMPKEQQDRLAASGVSPEAITLFTSVQTTKGKEPSMTKKPDTPATPVEPAVPAVAEEFDAKAAHEELMATLAELLPAKDDTPVEDPQITELKASIEALTAKVEALTEVPADPAAELKAGLKAGGTAEDAAAGSTPTTITRDLSAFKAPK